MTATRKGALKVKYLGIFPVTVPGEVSFDAGQTLAEVMVPLINACKMSDEFFWDHHLIIVNGRRPQLDERASDGDLLHILSYTEGG